MRSPFPGMDPYVEHPGRWQSFHSRFIVEIARAIESNLSPQYYVGLAEKVIILERDR